MRTVSSKLPNPGTLVLTDAEFTLLRDLIRSEAGIHLSDSKKPLLYGRLARRIKELGLSSFREYYHRLTEVHPEETEEMLNRICTNETHFFREPRQFEVLGSRLGDEWEAAAARGSRPRTLRVWSAACSTGEEPFSLAMALRQRFPAASAWDIDILATDLSSAVLRRARAAVWPIEKAAEIPEDLRKAFMLQGTGPNVGSMKAGPDLRALVRFARFNLSQDPFSPGGPFDLILCRNVLIYFDKPGRERVLRRLLGQLAPGGYLFLGHAESLAALPGAARTIGPAMYKTLEDARPFGRSGR